MNKGERISKDRLVEILNNKGAPPTESEKFLVEAVKARAIRLQRNAEARREYNANLRKIRKKLRKK